MIRTGTTIAARGPPRMLRAEERAAALIQQSNLVSATQVLEQGARLVARRRERATAVTVHLGEQALYLVKLGAAEAREWSRREIRCYRALGAIGSGVAIAPELVLSDLRRCVLVTQLLDPVLTLHDYFAANPPDSPAVLDGLSSVLASLHVHTSNMRLDVPPAMPWVLSEVTKGRDELLGRLLPGVRERAALLDRLARARNTWREEALIHGDLKWDNCLLVDDGEVGAVADVRLVDWELAGRGDPAWDLATALQEFLLQAHADCAAGSVPFDGLASEAGRAAGRLLTTYLRTAELTAARRSDLVARSSVYAGCRLVQTAFELAAVEGGPGPGARAAMDMARCVGENPDQLVAVLQGVHC